MIKNKSFFLLVLFSLFALNSNGHKHQRCRGKSSFIEKLLGTAVVGVIFSQVHPFLVHAQELCYYNGELTLHTLDFKHLKDYFAKDTLQASAKRAPAYILAALFARTLTAVIPKPIF